MNAISRIGRCARQVLRGASFQVPHCMSASGDTSGVPNGMAPTDRAPSSFTSPSRNGHAKSRLEPMQNRVDKVRAMEEGVRVTQRASAETLGAVLDAAKAERAHLRLKRMAAFDSHDYDPADNDLEEEALRQRTRKDYKSANRWRCVLCCIVFPNS